MIIRESKMECREHIESRDMLTYDDARSSNFTIDKITSMKLYDMNGDIVMNLMKEDENEI